MQTHIQERINKIHDGKLPEGYRKTKFGIVPIDWKDIKFNSIFEEIDKRTSDVDNYQLYSLTIENGVTPKTARYERSHLLKKTGDNYKIVRKDNFVYNPMNLRFGALARFKQEKEVCVSAYYDVFKTKSGFNSVFFEAYLKSYKLMHIYDAIATGSLKEKQRVHFSQFLKLDLPIPSKTECDKIAEILSTWDDAIRLQQELIEQKKTQKRGLMQLLLSGRIRVTEMGNLSPEVVKKRVADIQQGIVPEGYQKTKLGIIPKEWRIECFSELFDFDGGFSFSRKEYSKKGICCLHYGDIHRSDKTFIDIEKEEDYIPKIDISIENLGEKRLLEDGDIVFADASEDYEGIGKSVVIFNKKNIPFIAGLHTIVASSRKGSDEVHRAYRRFFLMIPFVRKQFCFLATGISVFGISKSNIKKIIVPLPSLSEQEKIAEILTTADKGIKLLETELEHLQTQKKGLMQLLLTGKIRVHEIIPKT